MKILLFTIGILGIVYCRRHHKHRKHKINVDYDMCVPKGDYATKSDLKKIVRDLLEIKILENQPDLKGPKGRNGERGPKGASGSCCKIYRYCIRTDRDTKHTGKRKSYVLVTKDTAYWHTAYLQCLQHNMTLPEPRSEADYAEMEQFLRDNNYVTDSTGAWTGITSFGNEIFLTHISDGEPQTFVKLHPRDTFFTSPPSIMAFSLWAYIMFAVEPRSDRYFFCEKWS